MTDEERANITNEQMVRLLAAQDDDDFDRAHHGRSGRDGDRIAAARVEEYERGEEG